MNTIERALERNRRKGPPWLFALITILAFVGYFTFDQRVLTLFTALLSLTWGISIKLERDLLQTMANLVEGDDQ